MKDQLTTALDTVTEWTIAKRRQFHAIPEPGFLEKKTSALIFKTLVALGYSPTTGIATTGVTAPLETGRPGPTIMLRADMDGLNLTEKTGLSFTSTHPGYAHCCGHDAHIAMLLGAAKVLMECKNLLCGTVLLVFQPAEEGLGGAKVMVEEGLMEQHQIEYVFGQHVWPALPQGTIGIKEGRLMAAVNHFTITIHGKGGHGAIPHECIDALEVGTQVVSALQRLSSRKINPLEPVVVTVGSFHAGNTFNIIADRAVLSGTTRTYNREIWRSWPEKLQTVIGGVCNSMEASFELEIDEGYPPLINDAEATEIAQAAAKKIIGIEVVEPEPSMAAEDMAFYHEKAKGSFTFLGCGYDGGASLHNPQFSCPEAVLATGVEMHCRLVFQVLGEPHTPPHQK